MTTRNNYDSAFCGSLPIHQINLVQPHGCLMVLDRNFNVIQVSENIYQLLGIDAAAAINTSFADFITQAQFQMLQQGTETGIKKIPLRFSFSGDHRKSEATAIVNVTEELLIIELELLPDSASSTSSFTDVYQRVKFAMAAVESAKTTAEVCAAALTELKKLSGFNKLMIYQFDRDWNGKVIAELKEEGMDSYLGLVFPASDIPRQARQLYLNNPYRLIPDVHYTPVKLYPVINPRTNSFLNLSDVGIRAVPAVHLEYMRNMGIKASMSTRILTTDHTLWGLISCHHLEPKFLTYEVCTIFELMSSIISARLAALQMREESVFYTAQQEVLSRLLRDVYSENAVIDGLMKDEEGLLKLVNADGVAVHFNKRLQKGGDTPARQQIEELIYWLKSLELNKVYHEERLSDAYEAAYTFSASASGILVIPVQPAKGDFIIFFRQEAVRKINWGGNPEEAIQFEKDSMTYHPRNSFKIWQQTVARTSLPWKSYELQIADQLRNFMLEFLVANGITAGGNK